MHTKSAPPYDPRVAAYEEETRMFEETVFHFLSVEDRRQWMQSALFNDLRVFQVGYFKNNVLLTIKCEPPYSANLL